jgi:hypothetical protein
VLFAVALRPKAFHYLAPFWPLLALLGAAGLLAVAQAGRSRAARGLVAALAVAACMEGAGRMRDVWSAAARATPYAVISARLAERLPRGVRLLALPRWWVGLMPHVGSYRSLFVPSALAHARFAPQPVAFEQTAERLPADAVLVDGSLLEALDRSRAAPGVASAEEQIVRDMDAWLHAHFRLGDTFEDSTYGRFEIWLRSDGES